MASNPDSCAKENALWMELHEWFVSNAKDKEADVLFIGGDHIALLGQSQFYLEHLEPLHCLCFGSFGDTIHNLLWRIERGEVENFTPKVIVVSIGQSDMNIEAENFLTILNKIAELLKQKQPMLKFSFCT
uniref:Uncharacterized protein n=1 Tax=Ditylenchus dipsaci TaxID=166011 RepID=A0A915E745_9BILA